MTREVHLRTVPELPGEEAAENAEDDAGYDEEEGDMQDEIDYEASDVDQYNDRQDEGGYEEESDDESAG